MGKINQGTLVGDFQMAPRFQGRKEEKQITGPIPLLTRAVSSARSSVVKVTLYFFAGISSVVTIDFCGKMPHCKSSGKLCLSDYQAQ